MAEARGLHSLSDLRRDVIQLAYVTDDIDAAVAWFEGTLGTTSCHTRYKSSLGGVAHVDGKVVDEWVIDVALVNAGPTNIELIRPVSGAVDLYRRGIRPGAPATFHHVGVRVEDFDEATALARSLKALADPMRLRLLSHIAAQGCDSVCACDLLEVVDISQPTVSHHLKKLVEAGLLVREQRGRWAHYTVVREPFDDLRSFLDLS